MLAFVCQVSTLPAVGFRAKGQLVQEKPRFNPDSFIHWTPKLPPFNPADIDSVCETAILEEIKDDPRYRTSEGCRKLASMLVSRGFQLHKRAMLIDRGAASNIIDGVEFGGDE